MCNNRANVPAEFTYESQETIREAIETELPEEWEIVDNRHVKIVRSSNEFQTGIIAYFKKLFSYLDSTHILYEDDALIALTSDGYTTLDEIGGYQEKSHLRT